MKAFFGVIPLSRQITPLDACNEVLAIDDSIRFVGRIKSRKLIAFARHQGKTPLLDAELGNLAHYYASVKASMEEMFDGPLGKTNWMITVKENVKLVTLFLDNGLLIFSIDVEANHDEIIKKIQSLNIQL